MIYVVTVRLLFSFVPFLLLVIFIDTGKYFTSRKSDY